MLPIRTLTRVYVLAVLLRIYQWLDNEPTPDAQGSNEDLSELEYPSRMLIHVSDVLEHEVILMEDRGDGADASALLPYWTEVVNKYIEEAEKEQK
ncbi:hypothetical protein LCGC14_1323830 [marine sediment metagenome]|uniref:Uncharacterized protein n=1 Tax=marine sediment metagenome TaxID=412755 RepID=A0A0F9KJ70_9ZZZZ